MLDILGILKTSFIETFTTGPFVYIWFILGKTWWLFTPLFLMVAAWWYWKDYIQTNYIKSLDWRCLSITVPKEEETTSSPKAMEQIFASAAGMMHGINMVEKYWKGAVQEFFSAELVGISGHIRFIFRVPHKWRDMFEANIYAQYPDAEIVEVEDYTKLIPGDFLEKGFEAWGSELKLTKEDAYPIRTYPEFEERITQEVHDPMASITELFSRFSSGEQLWMQWVCRPVLAKEHTWVAEGEKLKKKLIDQLPPPQQSAILAAMGAPANMVGNLLDQAMGYEVGAVEPEKKGMPLLTPDLYNALTALDRSLSKQGFEVKGRMFYVAKKGVFSNQRGTTGFFGFLQQFNTQNLNGFMPDSRTKTKVDYFMRDYREYWRKKKMLDMCQTRSLWKGAKPFILNVEELATVFHFPMPWSKSKKIEHVTAKKAGPPRDLPIAT